MDNNDMNQKLWLLILFGILPCATLTLANWMYLGMVGVSLHQQLPNQLPPLPGQQMNSVVSGPGGGDLNTNYDDHPNLPPFDGADSGGPLNHPSSAPGTRGNAVGEIICSSVPGLVNRQRQVCENHPDAMRALSVGARRGILECQHQFRNERWNCTTEKNVSVFGTTLQRGSRETAFIYAITSAGAVHAVTQACSAGNLTDCSCDQSMKERGSKDNWKWGGCSDNVHYGVTFAKQFVDAEDRAEKKRKGDIRAIMNLHNNVAGRLAVSKGMDLKCRCHGVSGSCELRTCWRTLPPFAQVGGYLKRKYEHSIQMSKKLKKRLRRRGNFKRRAPIRKEDLVHIHKSPNYCIEDPANGILGTSGRQCNKTATGPESCNLLCCGRGYNTRVIKHVERCHCKFHWCCYVTCKVCETMVEIYTCK